MRGREGRSRGRKRYIHAWWRLYMAYMEKVHYIGSPPRSCGDGGGGGEHTLRKSYTNYDTRSPLKT